MSNKYTQDMTGTGQHIELPDPGPEPERYYDWMLWKLRQEEKEQNMGTTFGIELYNDKEEPVQDKIDLKYQIYLDKYHLRFLFSQV